MNRLHAEDPAPCGYRVFTLKRAAASPQRLVALSETEGLRTLARRAVGGDVRAGVGADRVDVHGTGLGCGVALRGGGRADPAHLLAAIAVGVDHLVPELDGNALRGRHSLGGRAGGLLS